jgi:hypothetical protein
VKLLRVLDLDRLQSVGVEAEQRQDGRSDLRGFNAVVVDAFEADGLARDHQRDADVLGVRAAVLGDLPMAARVDDDSYKVQAVINEINGFDHSGTQWGTPAIFGMNFQTISTAQKLPSSDGKTGGYMVIQPASAP